MKVQIRKPRSKGWIRRSIAVSVSAFLTGMSSTATADQPTVSQFFGNTSSATDEYGYVLPGTDPEADRFGLTVVQGDLVQVLETTDGNIYPPNTDGTPHPNNVLLHETRVGLGVSPSFARSGMFGGAVSPRPGDGALIFVRVFNGRNLDEASFFGDSSLFSVSGWKNTIYFSEVTATDRPVDPNDADNDGVNNSWEKSYATDRDDDGVSNAEELIAGTDPKDPNDFLCVTGMNRTSKGVSIVWCSVPDKVYVVEYLPSGGTEYKRLAEVRATEESAEVTIPKWIPWNFACFRICAMEN